MPMRMLIIPNHEFDFREKHGSGGEELIHNIKITIKVKYCNLPQRRLMFL